MNPRDEKCPKCGSDKIAIARDMIGTRHCCDCHRHWVPEKEPKPDTVRVPRELWEKVKSDIEFYASVNREGNPGSWAMRKRFVFDLIDHSDLDSAHYEVQPKGKYYFGGKRARSSLEAIKKAGL